MGRPTKITKQVIDKLEEAFSWGCTDVEASLYADIATSTLYKYQEASPEFSERKAQLKETPILKARAAVIKSLETNPDLALKFLERRKRDEFSLRREDSIRFQEVEPILGGKSAYLLASANLQKE